VTRNGRYHRIADEIGDGSLEDWAAHGIAEIESYLAKHAAFHAFLDETAQSV
jgi:hypothetical protein